MSRVVWFAVSWPALVLLLIMAMVPIWGPLAGEIEGTVFPVTSKVAWQDPIPDANGTGIMVRMEFQKVRACEFLGATLDRDGVMIDFHPVVNSLIFTIAPVSVLTQFWHASTPNLTGVRLRFAYRCNPFWVTISTVYP